MFYKALVSCMLFMDLPANSFDFSYTMLVYCTYQYILFHSVLMTSIPIIYCKILVEFNHEFYIFNLIVINFKICNS